MNHESSASRWLFAGFIALILAAPASASAGTGPLVAGSNRSATGNLSGATSVAISGSRAYVTSYFGGQLTAVDISNPSAPAVPAATASAPSLVGADTVTISNGYAYVVSKNSNGACLPSTNVPPNCPSSANDVGGGVGNALTILNIQSNPAAPAIVGTLQDSTNLFGAYGVAIGSSAGHTYAYVAAQGLIGGQPQTPRTSTGSFNVIDVTNPAAPAIVTGGTLMDTSTGSTANDLEHADSVAVSGNYAYVTAGYAGKLTVIDISNPASPAIVASIGGSNLQSPSDIVVRGNYAYVTEQQGPGRLTIVDIHNPLSPQVVGTVADPAMTGAYRVRMLNNFAYVAGVNVASITAVDISNPLSPRVAGSISNGGDLNSTTGLDVDPTGNYVVASSPHQFAENAALFPYAPYPLQPGGPPSTGTVTDILLDPSPIGVTITSEPPSTTNQTSAGFAFAATDQISTVRCSLDGSSPGLCSSPTGALYGGLSQGVHAFTVTAIDAAGRTSSASYQWTVRILPPSVAIRTPANTATYALGSKVTASYSCTASTGSTVGSCSGPVANGSSIDTSRTGAHTFKVTAVDADGGTASSTVTYYVIRGPAGTGPGGAVKPVLRSVKETHRSWAVKKTSGHKKHKPPVGTTFTFTLNETASVTLTFSRHDPGRKVHKKCVAPTKKNRHAKSCTILTAQGAVVLNGHSGVNHVSFKGKTSRRTLKPGSYSVVISARSPGGTVSAKAMTFTIVSS